MAAVDESHAEQIRDAANDIKNGNVAVYDPSINAIREVPKDKAGQFEADGYKTGWAAEKALLDHSGLARAGAFLGSYGQAGSFGLLNLGLHATGHDTALKNLARAQEDNPGVATLGTLAGFASQAAGGVLSGGARALTGSIGERLALGGLAPEVMEAAAARGGAAHLAARVGNVALQNAPGMAMLGASNAVTEDAVLNKPITAEQLASSALSEILWNAGFNVGLHGISKVPAALRSGTGNLIQAAEKLGVLKSKWVAAESGGAEAGAHLGSETHVRESEYPLGGGPAEASPGPGPSPGEPMPSAEQGPATGPLGSDMAPNAAETTGQAMENAGLSGENPPPGMPPNVAQDVTGVPHPNATVEPQGPVAVPGEPALEPVPEVVPLAEKKARLAAEQAQAARAAEAERINALKPEDVEPAFDWPKGYSQRQKLHVIRNWIKEGAAAAHPDALAHWDIIQNLENAIGELDAKDPKHAGALKSMYAEKAKWKEQLADLFPRTLDKEKGIFSPGYDDLNAEYARAANPKGHFQDLKRPEFLDQSAKKFAEAEAAHLEAAKAAERAEAHAQLLETHRSELKARAEVIARNSVAKAEGRAAAKAANAEVKAANSEAAQARNAAKESAQKAREAEKRMKEAARAAPKSARTTRTVHTETTTGGEQRTTTERTEKNGRVKEKQRVVIKPIGAPPEMKFDGYEPKFAASTIGGVASAGYYSGLGKITGPIAAGMTGINAAVKLAGHHEALGKAFQTFFDKVMRVGIPVLRTGIRTGHQRGQESSAQDTPNVKDYPQVAKTVNYLKANPAAVVSHMQQAYPTLASLYPDVHHNTTMVLLSAIAGLDSVVPKKPYDPTLQNEDFLPTRAQQIKTLRTWQLLSNPHLGLDLADPDNVRILEQVYPQLVEASRAHIQDQAQRIPLTGELARQVSTYLGANVRPIDAAAALKRLQQTAGPPPLPPKKGGPGGGGGGHGDGHSVKVAQQAASREQPEGFSTPEGL